MRSVLLLVFSLYSLKNILCSSHSCVNVKIQVYENEYSHKSFKYKQCQEANSIETLKCSHRTQAHSFRVLHHNIFHGSIQITFSTTYENCISRTITLSHLKVLLKVKHINTNHKYRTLKDYPR